jgi:hypothetical protein
VTEKVIPFIYIQKKKKMVRDYGMNQSWQNIISLKKIKDKKRIKLDQNYSSMEWVTNKNKSIF